jgi:hypothetical protein
MFSKPAPASEPESVSATSEPESDLVPLSVLALELDPGEPWPAFLGRRGIAFRPDRIGRDAVSVGDAQRLIAERREEELKRQAVLRMQEQEAVERDQAWRASLPSGVPWYVLPDGVTFAEATAAAELAASPRTVPSQGEWLFGEHQTGGLFNGEADAS